MMRTVQLNCPIKAEIRADDSQSDFENFVIVMISYIIYLRVATSNTIYLPIRS